MKSLEKSQLEKYLQTQRNRVGVLVAVLKANPSDKKAIGEKKALEKRIYDIECRQMLDAKKIQTKAYGLHPLKEQAKKLFSDAKLVSTENKIKSHLSIVHDIRELARLGLTDTDIAHKLSSYGYTNSKGSKLTASTIYPLTKAIRFEISRKAMKVDFSVAPEVNTQNSSATIKNNALLEIWNSKLDEESKLKLTKMILESK